MLLTDANGTTLIEPIEIPTFTLETLEEVAVDEVMESTISIIEQPTPLVDTTPKNVPIPILFVLFVTIVVLVGIDVCWSLRNNKNDKKVAKKGK